MATDVVMPQMGESIAEGTIVKWLKKVGERVEKEEPLFEISTDKVDAEIPSPVAGVLTEIKANEGETVLVNSIVAVIDGAQGAVAAEKPKEAAAPTPPAPPAPAAAAPAPPAPPKAAAPAPSAPAPAHAPAPAMSAATGEMSKADLRRTRSSPLVRKIAAEHNVEISQIEGTGIDGRVTKNDILSFIENRGVAAPAAAAAAPAHARTAEPVASQIVPGATDEVQPMSVMRRKIAEHMMLSRRTSAHVATVFEVDLTHIVKLREQNVKAYQERYNSKLTFMPFLIRAAVEGIKKFPVLNSSVSGDLIIYHHAINVGIAVALDWGLIVPVIKNAEEKNLLGIGRAVNDLAERARNKQLKPDEVAGGTFTITNPGVYGGLFGTPIINQPQVAILGVGTIEKRPAVINDAIAIRSMCYLALSFDHRIIDGAVADQFMADVKHTLENFNPAEI